MKITIPCAVFAVITACFVSCATPQSIADQFEGIVGYWEDGETGNVHTIVKTGNVPHVSSVIAYDEGKMTEVMTVKSSSLENGLFGWRYFVPGTGYTVTFTMVSLKGDELTADWSNDDGKGNVRSGREILRRLMKPPGQGKRENNNGK
jgi:hypothetical protein